MSSATSARDAGYRLRKTVTPETTCLKCHGQMNYTVMGLPEPWPKSKAMFQNNCLLCHAAIRTARFDVIQRIADVARDSEADFVVVAGDVFEHHALHRETLQQTFEALRAFRCNVFLLPGNLLVSGGEDGRLLIWETQTGRTPVHREPSHYSVNALALSRSGRFRRQSSLRRSIHRSSPQRRLLPLK
jgi:hypothetical protein